MAFLNGLVTCLMAKALLYESKSSDFSVNDDPHCAKQCYGPDVMNGTFKSPNYPNVYPHNSCVIYDIEPRSGYSTILEVGQMDLGRSGVVEVLQYVVQHSRLIYMDVYTFEAAPENTRDSSARDIDNVKFFKFTSAFDTGYLVRLKSSKAARSSGFYMVFKRHQNEQETCPSNLIELSSNGSETYNFTTPSFDFNSGCPFLIQAEKGQIIKVSAKPQEKTTVVLVKECGFAAEPWKIMAGEYVSASNKLQIIVRQSLNTYRTYTEQTEIFIETQETHCQCDHEYITLSSEVQSGSIRSSNFQLGACPELTCHVRVSVDMQATKIPDKHAVFLQIVTENVRNGDCITLSFKDGDDNALSMLPMTSSSVMLVHNSVIVSMYRSELRAFQNYTIQANLIIQPEECTCGTTDSEEVVSEGVLEKFFSNKCTVLDCIWKLGGFKEEKQKKRLWITYSSTEDCGSDYVRINTMNPKRVYRSLVNLNMNVTDWYDIHGTNSQIYVHYVRDNPNSTCNVHVHLRWGYPGERACSCGDTELFATPEEQVLTSPNYPNNYCDNMNCTYVIRAQEGNKVTLRFVSFELEAFNDRVAVFDGTNTSGKHKDVLTGYVPLIQQMTSENETLTVLFLSDPSFNYKGFNATFIEVDLVGSSWPWCNVLLVVVLAAVSAILITLFNKNRKKKMQPRYAEPIEAAVLYEIQPPAEPANPQFSDPFQMY